MLTKFLVKIKTSIEIHYLIGFLQLASYGVF